MFAVKYAVNVWIGVFKEEAIIGKKSKPLSSIAATKIVIERAIRPLSLARLYFNVSL
jgi:hypothetical protein